MEDGDRCHDDHDRIIRLEQKLDALTSLTSDRWMAHGRVHEAESKAVDVAVIANRRLTGIAFAVMGLMVPIAAIVVAVLIR